MVARYQATHQSNLKSKQKILFEYTDFDSLQLTKEFDIKMGIPILKKSVSHEYDANHKKVKTIITEDDYEKRIDYLMDSYGRLEQKVEVDFSDSVLTDFTYDENNLLKVKTKRVFTVDGYHREAIYYNKKGQHQVEVNHTDSLVLEYFDNGVLQRKDLYNTLLPIDKRTGTNIYKVTRDGNLNIALIETLDIEGNKSVRKVEKFQYDESNQLVDYRMKKYLGKDLIDELWKKYSYLDNGFLFQVEEIMPMISYKGLYTYEFTYR